MWRLEKAPLGDLESDYAVIRLVRAFNWLPSEVRKIDRRERIILMADIEAEKGVEDEMRRRAEERKKSLA